MGGHGAPPVADANSATPPMHQGSIPNENNNKYKFIIKKPTKSEMEKEEENEQ